MKTLLVLATALTMTIGGLFPTSAADAKPAAAPGEKKADPKKQSKPQKLPFKGEVKAANQQAKTFTIGERTFHLTSQTRIQKAGAPATFQEVKVGEKVTGSYTTSPEGRLEAGSIYVGPKQAEGAKAKEAKAKEAKKEKGEPKAKKTAPKKEEPKLSEPIKEAPVAPEPKKEEPAPATPPPATPPPATPPAAPATPAQ